MKKLLVIFLIAVGLLGAILLVRAVTFTSRQVQPLAAVTIDLDRDAVVGRLAQAIRFKTVSQTPGDAREFQNFHAYLEKSFPLVHRHLDKEIINRQSRLYTWRGKDERLKPILLLAHIDVVPVDPATESSWTHAPFDGRVADNHVWGRGTMDDKASVVGILEAVEHLLRQSFAPARTVYLAFGHDEEIGGHNGAAKIAALLQSRGVRLEFVLDEGLNIVDGIIPGIAAPVALIGIAEKGYLSLRLTVKTPGGHSSVPPADTAIGILSRALQRLESRPFPARLTGPTRMMLEYLGPEMSWSNRFALANLWLFDPLVRKRLAASPLTNAAIRTTLAPTLFSAGVTDNVLPTSATAVVNLRLLPGDTVASAIAHVRAVIDDPRVQVTALPMQMEPSAAADVESADFKLLQKTIRQTIPETIVAPALLVAATDSRHYAGLSENIFRFFPITLRPEDAQRYHGIDERISIADYKRCIRFYAQLIRNSGER